MEAINEFQAMTTLSENLNSPLFHLNRISLMIIDPLFDEGGGAQFIKAIRTKKIDIPIILHSTYPSTPEEYRPFVDASLTKPVSLDKLWSKIVTILNP